MTYYEVVDKVREGFEYADAREIFEHVAVQVNIVGEGSGAFYIEVANRQVCVEPYDYYDRDGLFTADANTLVELSEGKLGIMEAITTRRLQIEGNMDKIRLLGKIKIRK